MALRFLTIIAALLLAAARDCSADTFSPVSSGSIYYCGQSQDGTVSLYSNATGTLVPASSKSALKKVSSLQSFLRQKVQRLQEYKREVAKDDFSQRDLAAFAKLIGEINKKGIDHIDPLPPNRSDRLDAIKNIIASLNTKLNLTKSEIKGIKDCKTGKTRFNGTFTASAVSVQDGLDTVVGALVTTAAKDGKVTWSTRWFCVALPGSTGTSARLFSKNPCVNGGLNVANCSALVPSGRIGYIEKYTTYGSTPSPDSLNNAINEVTEDLNSGPTTGRVRGTNGAFGTTATEKDRCG